MMMRDRDWEEAELKRRRSSLLRVVKEATSERRNPDILTAISSTNRIRNNGCLLCATFPVKFIELSRHRTDELQGSREAFFLHSSVLRCHAVNMERDNRGKAGDYRIHRTAILEAIESLMALTSRSHGHWARRQNYVTFKYQIIPALISCRLFVTLR